MDYTVQRCTRRCAATDRELGEGEVFYSVLKSEGAEVIRLDFCHEAWSGPPEDALGWWKSRMPFREENRAKLAPNEVLLQLFHEWEDQPEKQDSRFVLALLLTRRRVLRLEEVAQPDEHGESWMQVFCPRQDATFRVREMMPDERRAAEIQEELARLLFADAS